MGFVLGYGFGMVPGLLSYLLNPTVMALLPEIWVEDIQEYLTGAAEHLTASTDHSAFIYNSLVHLPQAGTLPASVKNRAVLPAEVSVRTDTDITYPIYHRSTDPIVVPDLNSFQLSYDKRQSVLGAQVAQLVHDAVRDVTYAWAPTLPERVVRTTGPTDTMSLAPGATGSRKRVQLRDIAQLARMFDADNVPRAERYLLLNPLLYYELFLTNGLLQRRDVMGETTVPKGVLGEVFGFRVLVNGAGPVFSSTGVPKDPEAVAATTDNLAGLAWQRGCVARAMG